MLPATTKTTAVINTLPSPSHNKGVFQLYTKVKGIRSFIDKLIVTQNKVYM